MMARYIRSLDPKHTVKSLVKNTICRCPEAAEGEHECPAIENRERMLKQQRAVYWGRNPPPVFDKEKWKLNDSIGRVMFNHQSTMNTAYNDHNLFMFTGYAN